MNTTERLSLINAARVAQSKGIIPIEFYLITKPNGRCYLVSPAQISTKTLDDKGNSIYLDLIIPVAKMRVSKSKITKTF